MERRSLRLELGVKLDLPTQKEKVMTHELFGGVTTMIYSTG